MSTYENKTNKPTHMNYLLGTRTFGLKLYVSDWALIHITNAEFMKNYQQQETRFCFENLWETSWFEFCTQMSQIWFEIRESHYTVENLSEFFNSPVFSVLDVGACIQFYSSVRNCSFQIPHTTSNIRSAAYHSTTTEVYCQSIYFRLVIILDATSPLLWMKVLLKFGVS